MQWQQINNIVKQQCHYLDRDFRIVTISDSGKIPAGMYAFHSKARYYDLGNPEFEKDHAEYPFDTVICDAFLDDAMQFRDSLRKFPNSKFFFVYCREKVWAQLTAKEKLHIPVKPQALRTENEIEFPWNC